MTIAHIPDRDAEIAQTPHRRSTGRNQREMSEVVAGEPPESLDDLEADLREESALETAASPLEQIGVRPAPTLMSEQEVLFSTAAAVPVRPTPWWTKTARAIATAMRAIIATSATADTDPRPKRRHYPPRQTYIEHARMEREMHGL